MVSTTQGIKFGYVNINSKYVFYNRPNVYAMVMHNQILPGHVLVCPKQPELRFKDLETEQLFELSLAIQHITKLVQRVNDTDSATVSI